MSGYNRRLPQHPRSGPYHSTKYSGYNYSSNNSNNSGSGDNLNYNHKSSRSNYHN